MKKEKQKSSWIKGFYAVWIPVYLVCLTMGEMVVEPFIKIYKRFKEIYSRRNRKRKIDHLLKNSDYELE